MKIAVSADGKDLNSNVSGMFGRCLYFIVAEIKDDKITNTEAIENISQEQTSGAGISAAKLVAEKGATVLITGNLGPRAAEIFQQLDIDTYKAQGNIEEAIQKFIDNKLEKIER